MISSANARHLAVPARVPAWFVSVLLALAAAPLPAASDHNPFLPPSNPGQSAAASPSENLEFAGWNAVGDKTYVSIFDKQLKKSRWIAVGSSEGSLSVLAYDARREQVVVKSGETQKTLTLRKSTGAANPVAPVAILPPAAGFAQPAMMPINQHVAAATPTGPVAAVESAPPPPFEPTAKPQTIQRQEEEARMLVSDLLEIGMAQRKAYEEAQKKAAEPPAPAAPAPTPSGP